METQAIGQTGTTTTPDAQISVGLAGATGAIGSQILSLLLSHPLISSVLLLSRRPIKDNTNKKWTDDEINKIHEVIVDDFNAPLPPSLFALPPPLPPLSIFFCSLGSTRATAGSAEAFLKQDRDLIIHLTRAVREAGVQQFSLVSSIGASPRSSNLYLKAKGDVEREAEACEFNWVAVWRPSILEAQRGQLGQPYRFGERIGVVMSKYLCCLCLCLCCPAYDRISVATVAKAMVKEAIKERGNSGIMIYDGSKTIKEMAK